MNNQDVIINNMLDQEELEKSELVARAEKLGETIRSSHEELTKVNGIIVFKNGRISMLKELLSKQNGKVEESVSAVMIKNNDK